MSNLKSPALLAELRKMAESGEISDEQLPRLIFASQIDIIDELAQLRVELQGHQHPEYATKTEQVALGDEVKAWKNRAIGMAVGAAASGVVGGAGLATLVTKLIHP